MFALGEGSGHVTASCHRRTFIKFGAPHQRLQLMIESNGFAGAVLTFAGQTFAFGGKRDLLRKRCVPEYSPTSAPHAKNGRVIISPHGVVANFLLVMGELLS
jgi:hypothetical protein